MRRIPTRNVLVQRIQYSLNCVDVLTFTHIDSFEQLLHDSFASKKDIILVHTYQHMQEDILQVLWTRAVSLLALCSGVNLFSPSTY